MSEINEMTTIEDAKNFKMIDRSKLEHDDSNSEIEVKVNKDKKKQSAKLPSWFYKKPEKIFVSLKRNMKNLFNPDLLLNIENDAAKKLKDALNSNLLDLDGQNEGCPKSNDSSSSEYGFIESIDPNSIKVELDEKKRCIIMNLDNSKYENQSKCVRFLNIKIESNISVGQSKIKTQPIFEDRIQLNGRKTSKSPIKLICDLKIADNFKFQARLMDNFENSSETLLIKIRGIGPKSSDDDLSPKCNMQIANHSISLNKATFDINHDCESFIRGQDHSKLILKIYDLRGENVSESQLPEGFMLKMYELDSKALESFSEDENRFVFDLISKSKRNNDQNNLMSPCESYRYELLLVQPLISTENLHIIASISLIEQPVINHPIKFSVIDHPKSIMDQIQTLGSDLSSSDTNTLTIKFKLLDNIFERSNIGSQMINCILFNFTAKVQSISNGNTINYEHVSTTHMTSNRTGIIKVILNPKLLNTSIDSLSISLRQLNYSLDENLIEESFNIQGDDKSHFIESTITYPLDNDKLSQSIMDPSFGGPKLRVSKMTYFSKFQHFEVLFCLENGPLFISAINVEAPLSKRIFSIQIADVFNSNHYGSLKALPQHMGFLKKSDASKCDASKDTIILGTFSFKEDLDFALSDDGKSMISDQTKEIYYQARYRSFSK